MDEVISDDMELHREEIEVKFNTKEFQGLVRLFKAVTQISCSGVVMDFNPTQSASAYCTALT